MTKVTCTAKAERFCKCLCLRSHRTPTTDSHEVMSEVLPSDVVVALGVMQSDDS